MSPEERPLPPEMIPEPWRDAGFMPPWPASKPPRRLLHLGLFLGTVVTTVIAGALQQGVNPLETPELLYKGIPFSFTLLLILGAHEMGHYKKKHILWMLSAGILQTGVMLYLLSLFISSPSLFAAFYMEVPSVYAGLVFFGILFAPMEFFMGMALPSVSRKNEFAADQFAVVTTGDAASFATALKKLAVNNLSNLTPHPFYVTLNYSHPPVLERLKATREEDLVAVIAPESLEVKTDAAALRLYDPAIAGLDSKLTHPPVSCRRSRCWPSPRPARPISARLHAASVLRPRCAPNRQGPATGSTERRRSSTRLRSSPPRVSRPTLQRPAREPKQRPPWPRSTRSIIPRPQNRIP